MSDLPNLRGPILEPASGGAPKQLVILCHGVGSDGQDLIDLAHYYQKALPDAKFVSPNAPFAYDMAPSGYQWFSLQDMSPGAHLSGTQQAAPILDNFIDVQLAASGLTESELALVGFSQGTMMCLYIGLRRELQIAGIIGYSGALVGEELLAAEIKSRPPVLLVHGDADNVVPPQALPATVARLEAADVAVKHEIRPELGHGLDDRGIMLGMDFLAESFGVTLPVG